MRPLLLLIFRLVSSLTDNLPSPFSPGIASLLSYLKENNSPTEDGVVLLDSQQTIFHNARNFSWRTSPSPPDSPWCSYTVADDPLFAQVQFEFVNSSSMPVEVTWYCDDDKCDHSNLGCVGDQSRYLFFIAVPLIMLIWAAIFKLCDAWPAISRKWRRRNLVPASYFEMTAMEDESCETSLGKLEEEQPPSQPSV